LTLIDNKTNLNIGLLGGSFDPIHFGHLAAANFVLENTEISQVYFVPVGKPWQKNQPEASGVDRLNMTKLATAGNQAFSVLDIEVSQPGISYTIDTVENLLQNSVNLNLNLILGVDAARTLPTWRRYQELKSKVSIIVVARENTTHPEFDFDFRFLEMPLLNISSSQIREKIKNNLAVDELLPKAVNEYIIDHNLYK
jgi:nicotinate-nucleotide adenylyltransferase